MLTYSLINQKKSVNLVQVTNPLKLVRCPELYNALLYETKWMPANSAAQLCMIMMDSKGSYPMFVKTRNDFDEPYMGDISNFIKNYKEQQLIENGRSSMIREIVAVDIDECFDVSTIWHKLRELEIPLSYTLTQNSLTKHWQIQFHLSDCFVIKKLKWGDDKLPEIVENYEYSDYIKLTLKLAKWFSRYFKGSDFKYRGVMCRNIYNVNQKTYVVNRNTITRIKDCLGQKPVTINKSDLMNWVDSQDIQLHKNTKIKLNEFNSVTDSRHELTLQKGREYIWNLLRNGENPTEDDLEEFLISISEDIGSQCGKPAHSIKEIKSQVKSIFEWSIKEYKPFYKSKCVGQTEASKRWNFNQRCNKIRKAARLKRRFLYYRSIGKTLGEIAELLNMSVVTLYTYLPLFAVVDLVTTSMKINNMYQRKCWNIIVQEISNKINELKELMKENGMHWSDVNFRLSVEDSENFVDYNIPLEGNELQLAA